MLALYCLAYQIQIPVRCAAPSHRLFRGGDGVRTETAGRLRLLGALVFLGLALSFPQACARAAAEAMAVWSQSFAPALFPFFVMIPALTGREATRLYERLFGRVLPRAFGVPAAFAGAVTAGFLAGSPAGALAISKTEGEMTRGEASRALLLASGLSPAFVASAVGAGMLGDPGAGALLLRSQILSQLVTGLLLRRAWAGDQAPFPRGAVGAAEQAPVRGAVLSMVTVCGYMVVFSVIAALAQCVLPRAGRALLPFLEVAGGCARLAQLPMTPLPLYPLLSFFIGLGGLSVAMQNLARARVPWPRYALGKALQGALAAAFSAFQCGVQAHGALAFSPLPCALFLGSAAVIVIYLTSLCPLRREQSEF